MDDKLDKLLAYDPLLEAEKCSGKSYKADGDTQLLGFRLHIEKAELARKMLSERGDSYYGMPFEEFISIVEDLGFESVYSEVIDETEKINFLHVYWHPDGILLTTTSYPGYPDGYSTNTCTLYYNWLPNPEYWDLSPRPCVTASGSWQSDDWDDPPSGKIWAGSHDGRIALKNTIGKLREHGSFLPTWKYNPNPWMIHYGDAHKIRGCEELSYTIRRAKFDALNLEKLNKLPVDVQEKIGVARMCLEHKKQG